MKNRVFGEYFARFEGIWQANCFKDEEVDRLSMEEMAKVREEKPMRVIMMMKRNTNDDEEVYRWWKGAWLWWRASEGRGRRLGGWRGVRIRLAHECMPIKDRWCHVSVWMIFSTTLCLRMVTTILAKSKGRSNFFLLFGIKMFGVTSVTSSSRTHSGYLKTHGKYGRVTKYARKMTM